VLTDRLGYVIESWQEGAVTDRTPLARRFGGYYVTGSEGPGHVGNLKSPLLAHEVEVRDVYMGELSQSAGGNLTDLSGQFDVSRYLTADSDVVALLVLAHQAHVHNLIVQAHEAADAVAAATFRLEGAVDRLLKAMLFVKEASLGGPIRGSTDFAQTFAARGPADDQGRSLRELDLTDRLFRYPLSFLIYSNAFDALPEVAQARFYRRLDAVLTGADQESDFDHLSEADRLAIGEILEATKPEFRKGRAPTRK
jgi:hypothetical protein